MAKKSMAKKLDILTKAKVNPKIIAGVVVLIGLIGLSFVGSSLLSTFRIAISNANDNSKGGGGEPGLIAYYLFDEGSGNIAQDKMIQNNGTIFGAQWTNNAILGKALNFSGPNNYVEVPNHNVLNPTDAITVSVWIKLNKTVAEQTYQYIILNKSNWDAKDGYQLLFNKPYSNNLIFRILYENTYKDAVTDASSLQKDAWYHIVGTYDKNRKELKLYIDGALRDVKYLDKPIDVTNNKLIIGNPGANYFNGSIDEVKIYYKALTNKEVNSLFQNTRCKRYTGIDPNNLTAEQYQSLTEYPLTLDPSQKEIALSFPWINQNNPGTCDKIFLIDAFYDVGGSILFYANQD